MSYDVVTRSFTKRSKGVHSEVKEVSFMKCCTEVMSRRILLNVKKSPGNHEWVAVARDPKGVS